MWFGVTAFALSHAKNMPVQAMKDFKKFMEISIGTFNYAQYTAYRSSWRAKQAFRLGLCCDVCWVKTLWTGNSDQS